MRLVNLLVCASVLCAVTACNGSSSSTSDAGKSGATAGKGGAGSSADGGTSRVDEDGSVASARADGGSAGHAGSGGSGTGGGSGSGAINPPVNISAKVADLAAALAGAICGALLDCVGQSKLDTMVGGEDCVTRVTLELSAGDLSHLQTSIDAGRVKYDATKLPACLTGIKQLGCKIQTDSFPASCEAAVGGTVALGGVCSISDDCQGDAFCQINGCPSHCVALLKAGDTCSKDDECGDKLVCTGGKCQAPAYEAEACAGTTGKLCAIGLSCWDGTKTQAGLCHTNAETLVGAKGGSCTPGSLLCQEGLSCVFDGSSAFVCASKVTSGAACYPAVPGLCPKDEYCDNGGGDPTVPGTCAKLPGDGQPCVGAGVCAPAYVCVLENQAGVCRAIHNNGGSCALNAACRSGYCSVKNICEPPPVCN